MSSLASTKDDNGVVEGCTTVTEQGNSENKPTEQGNSEAKTQEATIVTHQAPKEEEVFLSSAEKTNDSKDSSDPQSGNSQNVEIKGIPTTSTATEEVDSQRPSGSSNVKSLARKTSSTGRILLKRRSSRLGTPTIGGIRIVADEVDSAPPRSPKRRSHKKQMVALFLESDYPRKK